MDYTIMKYIKLAQIIAPTTPVHTKYLHSVNTAIFVSP